MTMTDTALRGQNSKRTFSYVLLISGLLPLNVPIDTVAPPQYEDFVSYEQGQYTSSSHGTLEVKETFVTDANILEALAVLHESLLQNQIDLNDDLSRLLYTDMEALYA